MAGRYANNDAQRSMKRMGGELNITQDQKDLMVKIAIAHLAAGNVGDFTTAITAITRAETINDVTDRLNRLEAGQTREVEALKSNETSNDEVPAWALALINKVEALSKGS